MTVEYFGSAPMERILVTVEPCELSRCGISFERMSLSDPPTRGLLRRLTGMVTRLGLRRDGQSLRVDCAETESGGCALLFSVENRREYHFACTNHLLDAYRAGVLPEGRLTRAGEGWVLAVDGGGEKHGLREFCFLWKQ